MTGKQELTSALLAETREELAKADQKASILFAVAGIAVAAVLSALLAGDWSPNALASELEITWWAGAVLVGSGVVALLTAVYPRSHRHDRPNRPRDVYYFGDIARLGDTKQLDDAISRTDEDERRLDQIHRLSKLATFKYDCVRWGLLAASAGFAVWIGIAIFRLT